MNRNDVTEMIVRAGDDGRTPGPGWRKCTAYRQTGPGGLPLALRLSEWLGLACCVTCHTAELLFCIELQREPLYPSRMTCHADHCMRGRDCVMLAP